MALDAYVMRHGETEANVNEILMGREDSPFTEAGWRQPVEVAEQLKGREISCIYSSPMARARRTARLVVETLGRPIPVKTAAALAEIDAGGYTGLSFREVRARVPNDAVLGQFRYPGGESWGAVQARAVEFIAGLEAEGASDGILLVTHAGVIAGLVASYVGEPIERFIRTRFGHDFLGLLRVEDGAITRYEQLAGTVDTWF